MRRTPSGGGTFTHEVAVALSMSPGVVGMGDSRDVGGDAVSLPDEVRSHHTAWVGIADTRAARRPVPVRYALAGESLVMFGDEELAELADGSRVTVTIHEIHDGPPVAAFTATLRDLDPAEVDMEALAELVAHVSLGRDLTEVTEHLDDIRAHRRVVALGAF
jgi:hypothetical protein